MEVVPYKDQNTSKKAQVARMFDSISRRYDFLNHFLSLGIDINWRRKAVDALKDLQPAHILDIATGTGDMAIEALRLKPKKVVGIDISKGMLEKGREKIKARNYESLIELQYGDSEDLHFADNNFDAATVAFGVRNFENLEKGISEIHRVLTAQGRLVVLEFSRPTTFPVNHIFNFYFNKVLPKIGRIISRDNSAYSYLPASVQSFPDGEKFAEMLKKCGFNSVTWKALTFGISTIYVAQK